MIYQIREINKPTTLWDGYTKAEAINEAEDYYQMIVDEDEECGSGIHEFHHVLVWGDNEEFSENLTITVEKEVPERMWYAA